MKTQIERERERERQRERDGEREELEPTRAWPSGISGRKADPGRSGTSISTFTDIRSYGDDGEARAGGQSVDSCRVAIFGPDEADLDLTGPGKVSGRHSRADGSICLLLF
jgi:hypothetical protein